jgi:hypothetical protein
LREEDILIELHSILSAIKVHLMQKMPARLILVVVMTILFTLRASAEDKDTELLNSSLELLKQAEAPNTGSPKDFLKTVDEKLRDVSWNSAFKNHHWYAVKAVESGIKAIENGDSPDKVKAFIDKAISEIKAAEAAASAPPSPS